MKAKKSLLIPTISLALISSTFGVIGSVTAQRGSSPSTSNEMPITTKVFEQVPANPAPVSTPSEPTVEQTDQTAPPTADDVPADAPEAPVSVPEPQIEEEPVPQTVTVSNNSPTPNGPEHEVVEMPPMENFVKVGF